MCEKYACTKKNWKELIQSFVTRIIEVYSEWQPNYDMISERYPGMKFEKVWRDKSID